MQIAQSLLIPFEEFSSLTQTESQCSKITPSIMQKTANVCFSQKKAVPLRTQTISTKRYMANISKATQSNWEKLQTSVEGRLAKRANKTLSTKKVIASSYAQTSNANLLLHIVSGIQEDINDVIYTLCVRKLQATNIYTQNHVQLAIEDYATCCHLLPIEIPMDIWNTDEDLLGYIYQSLMQEGERIATGQYYTNRSIVSSMLNELSLKDNETFYDPCCGSGAFLLGVKTERPDNLYGTDISPLAVLITRVNLLCKYAHITFTPNIYCVDFLAENSGNEKYDYIYTNPPWGADKENQYKILGVKSKERASMFLIKATKLLKTNGHLHFLLPTSLLKIQTHKDLRSFILKNATIEKIELYNDRFDGVFTDYFSIKIRPVASNCQEYFIQKNGHTFTVSYLTTPEQTDIPITETNPIEESIKQKVANKANDYLTHSKWALGIVTGNNKEKLLSEKISVAEPIYTGKEIEPFIVSSEKKYVVFNPANFQQCAKEEYFRAPEKLVYRFIANRPIVAYDDKQRLYLNSANILIPDIDTISTKTVAAFLNSALYQYLYITQFSDCKVLKSNLCTLPFPMIPSILDVKISQLVTQMLHNGDKIKLMEDINSEIFRFFDITTDERKLILQSL